MHNDDRDALHTTLAGDEHHSSGHHPGHAAEHPQSLLARRLGYPNKPGVTLVPPPSSSSRHERSWEGLPHLLITGDPSLDYEHPYVVVGGPGTGKSSVLVDAAVAFLRNGGSSEDILFVAPNKESASHLNDLVVDACRSIDGFVAEGTIVRSVHSIAYSLLRAAALKEGAAAPRLMSGAEHDVIIRELLLGHVREGIPDYWPDSIRDALAFTGFARTLRDFLLRATERNVDEDDLIALGTQHDRPMWVAAGHFLREYNHVVRLGVTTAVNVSELLHRALATVESSEGALPRSWKPRLVLIDDAHNLDPAAARLITALIPPDTRTIVTGDNDQCVFRFRGANADFLHELCQREDNKIVLSRSHRLSRDAVGAVRAIAERLPITATREWFRSARGDLGSTSIIQTSTSTAMYMSVADAVARAHSIDGVPWDDIAIIVRNLGELDELRRTLLAYDIPVTVDATSLVLANQPLVSNLLLALQGSLRPLTPAESLRLLRSRIGGMDPYTYLRIERSIARSFNGAEPRLPSSGETAVADCLADLLNGTATSAQRQAWMQGCGPMEQEILLHVLDVLDAGRKAVAEAASVEQVLWAVWQATGLATRLQTVALRGGAAGSNADHDLDAVMSLFDMAGDFTERHTGATVDSFITHVLSQELPTGAREHRGVRAEAVEILPAHAAAGMEWDTVIIAGVRDAEWPAGPTVSGIFHQSELVDLIDRGIEPHIIVDRYQDALQDERRLFLLALSRARRSTIIITEDKSVEGRTPSRFLDDIVGGLVHAPTDDQDGETPGRPDTDAGTAESLEDIEVETLWERAYQAGIARSVSGVPTIHAASAHIAHLRQALFDASLTDEERDAAARCLVELAEVGMYGADPESWWETTEPSTSRLMVDPEEEIRLSPSKLDAVRDCPLQYLWSKTQFANDQSVNINVGILFHAIAEDYAQRIASGEVTAQPESTILDDYGTLVDALIPRCFPTAPHPEEIETEVKRVRAGLENLGKFCEKQLLGREGLTIATEVKLSRTLPGAGRDQRDITVSGHADLLLSSQETPSAAHVIEIYDHKTGNTPPTSAEVNRLYQLAGYRFLVDNYLNPSSVEAAALVYHMKNSKPINQDSAALDLENFTHTVLPRLADETVGPTFAATPQGHNKCRKCSFRTICPAYTAHDTSEENER